jgi:hypothetical protein
MTPDLFKPGNFLLQILGKLKVIQNHCICVSYDVEEFLKHFSFVLKFMETCIYACIYIHIYSLFRVYMQNVS